MSDKESINRGIGERVRRRRLVVGLSQADLAARCGKSGNSWTAAVEAGRIQLSAVQLLQVAGVLGVDPASLLGAGEQSAPSPPDDLSCGGPPHPALTALRAGLWLPERPLVTVWPSVVANPQDLPLAGVACVAVAEAVNPAGRGAAAAWLAPSPARGTALAFTFVSRPRHWRQREALSQLDLAHEVLMFLPG